MNIMKRICIPDEISSFFVNFLYENPLMQESDIVEISPENLPTGTGRPHLFPKIVHQARG